MGSIPGFLVCVKVYKERMIMARREHQLVKAGFTLVELLVYIAIVGIVVIVAGQAFSNSTKMRVRTQSMLKASEVAENVAMLFGADVAQTGAKSSMESGSVEGGNNFSAVNTNVYINPDDAANPDLSSFSVTSASGFSDLIVRRMRYDANGHYVAVEEVNWFVENNVLKRSCRTIAGTADAEDCKGGTAANAKKNAVEIATGITKFEVKPAQPGVTSDKVAQIFPPCDAAGNCAEEFRLISRAGETDFMPTVITSSADHKIIDLSGFETNYNKLTNSVNTGGKVVNQVLAMENANKAGASWKSLCRRITLEPMTEYEISFSLTDGGVADKMRMFVPGRDQMSVGFRNVLTGLKPEGLDDFLFFPPVDEKASGTRAMRFSVGEKIDKVCLAFTFVSYSPIAANGKVTISELRLKKVESSNYKFDYPDGALDVKDKANVKALRLVFGVQRNGEEGSDTLIVRIPSNGPKD